MVKRRLSMILGGRGRERRLCRIFLRVTYSGIVLRCKGIRLRISRPLGSSWDDTASCTVLSPMVQGLSIGHKFIVYFGEQSFRPEYQSSDVWASILMQRQLGLMELSCKSRVRLFCSRKSTFAKPFESIVICLGTLMSAINRLAFRYWRSRRLHTQALGDWISRRSPSPSRRSFQMPAVHLALAVFAWAQLSKGRA